jgi:hypothetical protein
LFFFGLGEWKNRKVAWNLEIWGNLKSGWNLGTAEIWGHHTYLFRNNLLRFLICHFAFCCRLHETFQLIPRRHRAIKDELSEQLVPYVPVPYTEAPALFIAFTRWKTEMLNLKSGDTTSFHPNPK